MTPKNDGSPKPATLISDRRAVLGSAGLLVAGGAAAMPAAPSDRGNAQYRDAIDQHAIDQLIQRERRARDAGLWDEMLSYYHPQAEIDVSWFHGGAADFVARTRATLRPDNLNFHQLSPACVWVNGDRAIADSPCALQGFMQVDGCEVNLIGHTHLLWRARRAEGRWLLAGLRAIYVRDILLPVDPGISPSWTQPGWRAAAHPIGISITCSNRGVCQRTMSFPESIVPKP